MPCSLADILSWTGGEWVNRDSNAGVSEANAIRVSRPAQLSGSERDDVVFFFSKDYQEQLLNTRAGILVTAPPFVEPLKKSGLPLWKTTAVVSCPDPYFAMALISEKLAESNSTVSRQILPKKANIHPTAVVDSNASIADQVEIGAYCVIEAGVVLEKGVVLYPGVYVGPDVKIGEGSVLFPKVTVYEKTQIGRRARIHAGAVIGADGFGYAPQRQGKTVVGHQKIYHIGRVVLGDDVEIGANACIDRATFGETRLGNSVKIDNLVQVGHNVTIGEGSVICGGSAVAGSAEIGKFVYVGGVTGITNVRLGDGAQVGALTLATKDIPIGGTAVGNPQRTYREHFKAHAYLNRLLEKKNHE